MIAIVGDWDADGVVSAAEIYYSQRVLGLYPVRGVRDVVLAPASAKDVDRVAEEVVGKGVECVVFLDIAYSRYMDRALSTLRSRGVRAIYIDHHISTAIHLDSIRSRAQEVVVGKTSTAMLVYGFLRSAGVDLSERLKAFVEAVTVIEKGAGTSKQVNRRLVDIVASISRSLAASRDRDLWARVVKWLTEPVPMAAMPFALDVGKFVRAQEEHLREVKAIANEVAVGCIKVFDLRLADIRGRRYGYKSTTIASALHRVLKTPVALIARSGTGRDILVIRSRGALAYDIALYLYRRGVAEDLMGHQSLVVALLKQGVNRDTLVKTLREFFIGGPAGI